jgi:hypothetical protein
MWRLPSAAAIHSRSLPRVDAMMRGTGRSGRTVRGAQRRDLKIDCPSFSPPAETLST